MYSAEGNLEYVAAEFAKDEHIDLILTRQICGYRRHRALPRIDSAARMSGLLRQ